MLLKSIIRKTLGIRDHVVRRVREEGRSLIVELDRHKGRLLSCRRCGKRHRVRDRLGVRQWRHVPLWGIPVFLEYAPAGVKCPTYGKVVVEAMPWSAGKTPENLTDQQRARLGYLEKLNLRCNRAYLLKEAFREFWTYTTKGWARKFLKKWFWWAAHSRLKPIQDFAWMLRRRQDEILNHFDLPINNAAVEGLNNKAKVVSRRCCGFRTPNTFITALYHVLGHLPEPPMMHKFL